jgi:hypothetical protein
MVIAKIIIASLLQAGEAISYNVMTAKLPILFFGELFNRSINELIGRLVD